MLSLCFANSSEEVVVTRVSGKDEEKKHLHDLGIIEGERMYVISNHNGDIIAEVKNSRLAITKEMSMKIFINIKNDRIANN